MNPSRQMPKTPLSRRALQWLAFVPSIFIPSARKWLLKSLEEDRKERITYLRYLNRR